MDSAIKIANGVHVSRETIDALQTFVQLVAKWNDHINLISRNSMSDIWDRHIVDSVQLFDIAPKSWRTWADIGSGGGFPGIVVAIIAAELNPKGHVTLIESDQRKAAFLQTSIRELKLSATVLSSRIEAVQPLNADVVSARALGPLSDLVAMASIHCAGTGCAIFPKGRKANEEIAAARAIWAFDLMSHPSCTDSDAQVLVIKSIAHV